MIQNSRWPDSPTAEKQLVTFDGGARSRVPIQQPDRYSFFRTSNDPAYCAIRGAGLSFAPASFADETVTIDMRSFDRILDFDGTQGIVEVEAGITLMNVFYFLQARGFYLPIQPGYPTISVGGCIAADVHGKNAARDGTFINQVESLRLFHPSHGSIEISPEVHSDLFRATCGGFGLTGIIITARLRASRLPAAAVQSTLHVVSSLPEGAATLSQLLSGHDFAFGWHDLSTTASHFGRGWITAARFVKPDVPSSRPHVDHGMTAEARQFLPFPLLNRVSTRAMNRAYRLLTYRRKPKVETVFRSMFPFHGKEGYFKLFGRAGFHESQVIVPHDRFADYVEALQSAAARTNVAICLAATKLFNGTNDLIRFDGTGVSLAIEFPRSPSAARFLEIIDRLTVEVGGRPNAIKDSRLPRDVFEATYWECDRFRSIIQSWDPRRLFRSTLTTRLGL